MSEDPATRWTPEAVETLIALSATHRTAHDQGQPYPVIEWRDEGPHHLIDLIGYLKTTDGLWFWRGVFVIHTPPEDERRGIAQDRRGIQTFETRDYAEIVHALTGWLNELRELPARLC